MNTTASLPIRPTASLSQTTRAAAFRRRRARRLTEVALGLRASVHERVGSRVETQRALDAHILLVGGAA